MYKPRCKRINIAYFAFQDAKSISGNANKGLTLPKHKFIGTIIDKNYFDIWRGGIRKF